ncbi:GSCFA domain-containing protein [Seonamhaeicola sp.]|uniref:GSCFA domain-containing protein n=1 Tax=Seonamhaeicola sp. TaxID=1912245 RepID=UPI002637DCBA|nr:GSCFA domain-containing protein [Seonamhaeicola sp.]
MNLQTKIPLSRQSDNQIGYESEMLLLGSCFVENIGEKLGYFKFQSEVNPFGILFHPQAIKTLVENAIKERHYTDEDAFFNNEQWHCFDAHSRLSNSSKDSLLGALNKQIKLTNKQIHSATHIIITLGTSWVYRHKETGNIVANCHKVPQKQFSKDLLSVEEVVELLRNTTDLIRSVNPKTSIIFTVSPVRHLKDGFVENTQSKAHLITAIHQFLNQNVSIENRNSFYFPSYEIMMDELRDYRFYKDDMIHPSQIAVNYIWDKFNQVWITSEAQKTMEDVDAVQKGLLHKPFNPNSEAHQKFLQKLEAKINKLQSRYSHIKF